MIEWNRRRACANQISQIFFHNRIFYKLYRKNIPELYVSYYPPTFSCRLGFFASSYLHLHCLHRCACTSWTPRGKAPAPTPPYRQDAQKGYLPSVPFPHAGPEPSGQAPRSFLKGNSLDGSRAAFSLKAIGMEYESDPPDSDDESICDPDDPDGSEYGVECCIVATFSEELGIPCQNPDCPRCIPIPHPSSVPDPSRESRPPSGSSPGAGPSGVYGSLGGDSSS